MPAPRSRPRPFREFFQIPGPNPILVRGGPRAWDEACLESCDVLKDYDTYYLYYHAVAKDPEAWPRRGYQLGVATAPHPLGPWTKHAGNPVLEFGPPGSWDDAAVACASILKEGPDRYLMWYSGKGREQPGWSLGLATASSPLGPWQKFEQNPVLERFGYVGAVLRVDGKYRLYTEHPIGATGPDYGPLSLAIASRPEGPWLPYEGNPVLAPGDWGAWDDGGISEAEVNYHEGLYHLFYGGAKLHPVRIRTLESIGYAWSGDGVRFHRYAGNPVARREASPDASAFAEVHSLIEPPFIYCYHTLRYLSSEPGVEDLGVQVLATRRPFQVVFPLLALETLAPAASSPLAAGPPVSLEHAGRLSLTVACYDAPAARRGIQVHVRTSQDGLHYDTQDLCRFENDFAPGQRSQRTVDVPVRSRFAKVVVENQDPEHAVTGIEVTAVLDSR